MKINWGTAIVLAFIGFISFIMYFVIKMNTEKKYEHDLVTEDYYKQELAFQTKIDAEKNARALSSDISFEKIEQGILVSFPLDKKFNEISGSITLYRPSNKKLDIVIPIALREHRLVIPKEHLIEGRWDIMVDWEYENIKYLSKKSITY